MDLHSTPHMRMNSEITPVPLTDIRPVPVTRRRKYSCDCEACGGERLRKTLLLAVLPKREREEKEENLMGIRKLTSMVRCSYRVATHPYFPGMGFRLSQIFSETESLYTKPPVTPALTRYLSTSQTTSPTPKPRFLPAIRETPLHRNIHIPALTLPSRTRLTTPSTSLSEAIGSLSSRSRAKTDRRYTEEGFTPRTTGRKGKRRILYSNL